MPRTLRVAIDAMTEAQWMADAQADEAADAMLRTARHDRCRPAAIYRYVKSVGPAEKPAPAYVPPGGNVTTPFIVFVPQPPSSAPR